MSTERKPFINVDELMPQVALEQAARYYGAELPELKKVGSETRTACFLNCGKKEPTGDRTLAIHDDATKKWHCHQYGCGKGGNLVGLCDLMKPGQNAAGRPRGERFKEIAKDLQEMVGGQVSSQTPAVAAVPKAPPAEEAKVNVPLKHSDNERARPLIDLDRKFAVDVTDMPPAASAYFRRRPFLTPEVARAWRMGYLPRDVGGKDKSGGTMRGKITYAYLNDAGEVLTWFGRDPEFEAKIEKWEKSDRKDPKPEKFHFVRGYHRGSELYGVHELRAETREKLQALGCLPLVEGPNDVIRLSLLGVPAVALCSNTITREQALKVAALAQEFVPGGVTGIFLDCDEEGLSGMRQCLGYISQVGSVRLLWTDRMFAGKFKGLQPENLRTDDMEEIKAYLVTGEKQGWSLT